MTVGILGFFGPAQFIIANGLLGAPFFVSVVLQLPVLGSMLLAAPRDVHPWDLQGPWLYAAASRPTAALFFLKGFQRQGSLPDALTPFHSTICVL